MAWVEVYRGLGHRACVDACALAIRREIDFPPQIMTVAREFKQLQEARERADYDPKVRIDSGAAAIVIGLSQKCLRSLKKCKKRDRIAFATWLLITTQGAKAARTLGDSRDLHIALQNA
ncbi:hypothetical protein [Falsirhodobacter halotolerans]|uniref:hypothetical protein n=1 Tax=Falsirhodobacter halotolerans TaxID=1146892 RepID=UPI001FD005C7|nr:hypothetical protein [Falsirhodobacter halotolerans]MCJ8138452.1 hypothetical protein [Falsirhodobacter halotolerans]